jgi:flagellar assembly factor FliW
MPLLETKSFGRIPYELGAAIEFPTGLPGFESRKGFVAIEFADTAPLVFLQSTEEPGLCFITLPVLVVDPEYRLQVSAEDLELVGLTADRQPRLGEDILCLVVLSLRETGPTANLLAPVLVNLHNRRAVQSVAADSGYSHQHALLPEEAAVCS